MRKLLKEWVVFSEEDTVELAKEFSMLNLSGKIIVLDGEIGAGKTFFVKKYCELISFPQAFSPTFTIVNEYRGNSTIFHFDFYRIISASELTEIGFDDYIIDSSAIIFIEWGNMFEEILPMQRLELKFEVKNDFSRKISLYSYE